MLCVLEIVPSRLNFLFYFNFWTDNLNGNVWITQVGNNRDGGSMILHIVKAFQNPTKKTAKLYNHIKSNQQMKHIKKVQL